MRTFQKLPSTNIITNPNVSQYEKWITSAIQGDASAEYKLAYFYLTGDGLSKDPQIALYWFGRAAAQGYEQAMIHLGFCYQYECHVENDVLATKKKPFSRLIVNSLKQ